MSLQMRRMRRNAVILSIQQENKIHRRKHKTCGFTQATILVRAAPFGSISRSSVARALYFKSLVLQTEPRVERVANNIARLFDRRL